MSAAPTRFNLLQRVLHWLMAAMILAMLFIGAGMMTSLRLRPALLDLHVPLGLAILLLVVVRLANRLSQHAPDLPDTLPHWQILAAKASHVALYGLMIVMPLLGWATLSAGGFPIVPFPGVHLPPIVPASPVWHAYARTAHGLLAWLLFAIVLIHLSAGLLHAWVLRDGVFGHIALWRRSQGANRSDEDELGVQYEEQRGSAVTEPHTVI